MTALPKISQPPAAHLGKTIEFEYNICLGAKQDQRALTYFFIWAKSSR